MTEKGKNMKAAGLNIFIKIKVYLIFHILIAIDKALNG